MALNRRPISLPSDTHNWRHNGTDTQKLDVTQGIIDSLTLGIFLIYTSCSLSHKCIRNLLTSMLYFLCAFRKSAHCYDGPMYPVSKDDFASVATIP